MNARAEISVTGVVQGVGFRPFIYRLALRLNLKGLVRNMGDAGVQIIVEGDRKSIENFLKDIRIEHPPLAIVEDIKVEWKPPTGEFVTFKVEKSEISGLGSLSSVPPDIALCDDCLREMLDPKDRRYLYPFITCVNCGPRFTIIESLPYDRPKTSMADFPLCEKCLNEYSDPNDRRYHAEPTCCPVCGPTLELYSSNGEKIDSKDPAREVAGLLDGGFIVAIKGIGGIHIAAKTTDDEVIARLRKNFNRPYQPFAVMAKNLEAVKKFAKVNEIEASLITSHRRPIVVLQRSENFMLSELIGPGLDSIGVMLPYSGIHHLILNYCRGPAYIMTSANLPGLPMIIKNEEALQKLRGLVDYLLLHNRRIVNRCDDSVVKVIESSTTFLRRSRGYTPDPLPLKFKSRLNVLAVGAELNNTASLLTDNKCFITQHVGDTTKIETLEYLQSAITALMRLLNIERIDLVAHDLHPNYATTRLAFKLAKEFGAETLGVQHHYAHLCSLMAEHGLDEIVGIAADGVGYGQDGTAWGGEVILADMNSFKRLGGLMKQRMPGGDLAAQFPARMVAGMLWEIFEPDEIRALLEGLCFDGFRHGKLEIDVLIHQLDKNINVPLTSSCGRVLDAVACVLGVCNFRTYEGEPAIKLEAAANEGKADLVKIRPSFKSVDGFEVVDTSRVLGDVIEALRSNLPRKHIAAAAQEAVAKGLADLAIEAAEKEGIKVIGASGGVFYNRAITSSIKKSVERAGLAFVMHRVLPPGDGCISAGQAVHASHRCD